MSDLNFPRQVSNSQIIETLQNFYKQADSRIEEVFSEFERISSREFREGVEHNSYSEKQYNQKEFRRILNEVKSGNSPIKVSWYDAEIINSTPPRLNTEIKEFQIDFRYGKWFKSESVVT